MLMCQLRSKLPHLPTSVGSENVVPLATFGLTFVSPYHRLHDVQPFMHIVFGAEVPPRIGPGKPCAPSSTRCPETKHEKAPLDDSGPSPLGFPVAILGRLATVVDISPTRHRHPVAQEGVSVLLEMEEPTQVTGSADGPPGRP